MEMGFDDVLQWTGGSEWVGGCGHGQSGISLCQPSVLYAVTELTGMFSLVRDSRDRGLLSRSLPLRSSYYCLVRHHSLSTHTL